MKLPTSAPPRQARCYVPAPPLTRTGSAAEGAELLRELPGERGVVMWGTLRDVMLYLATPAAERGALYPPGAAAERRAEIAAACVEPELWAPLLVVAEMMEDPAGASRARLAHACRAISRWAEGHAPATRLAFAQAAALARPGDPRLALSTARLARDAADSARAETWFRRAVKLARGKDWEAYIRAFLGLGIMYQRGGNYPAAGVVVGRALRAARRRRLRALQGDAHHELFVIALGGHRTAAAYSHAGAALEAYGPSHPRMPYLAHDVGVCWFESGRFDLALPVFEHLLPCFASAPDRARVLANIARAAGGAGMRARYEESRAAAMEILARVPDAAPIEAELLVIVAHADNAMGEWRRAERTATRAAELAAAQGASQFRLLAEAQAECARSGRAIALARAEAEPLARKSAEHLARELTSSLARRAAAEMAAAV